MRIAICDDNREDVLSLRKLLEGHEVRIFSEAAGLLSDLKKGGITGRNASQQAGRCDILLYFYQR